MSKSKSKSETPGQWLKRKFRAADLTAREVAAKVGCSVMAVHMWTADRRRPSKKYCEVLGVITGTSLQAVRKKMLSAPSEWKK